MAADPFRMHQVAGPRTCQAEEDHNQDRGPSDQDRGPFDQDRGPFDRGRDPFDRKRRRQVDTVAPAVDSDSGRGCYDYCWRQASKISIQSQQRA